jgi:predicted regulator of Ras-like GTPase activity (Roadblock/LC7/MglB family)
MGADLAAIRVSLERFYTERAAADGRAAIAGLEKLLARDPGHARAIRLMAELASRIGALPKALEALTQLQKIVPDDPSVAAWRKAVEDALAGPFGKVDFARALREVEETGQFPDPVSPSDHLSKPAAEPRKAKALDAARPTLTRLSRMPGVRLVLLVRGSSALVRGAPAGAAEGMARAMRAIAVTAKRTTRRLGHGTFQTATIEAEGGVLVLHGGEASSSAVVVDGPGRVARVRGPLADLAAAPPIDVRDVVGEEGVVVRA